MIPAGNHLFSWVYEKDVNTLAFDDAAWVDYIKFPPFSPSTTGPLSVSAIAVPATICAGEQSQLYAFATGGSGVYSYEWTPSATLNNPTIFNPLASPTESTAYDVLITNLVTVSGSAVVNVEHAPVTPTISIVNNHLLSSAPLGNQWYNNQGIIPGATSQVYTPVSTNVYYVKTSSAAGCESDASNSLFFGFTGIQPTSELGISVHPNPFADKFVVDYNLTSDSYTKIALYNALGKEVIIIEEGEKTSGNHQVSWDGSALASGVYYCRIFSADAVQIQKLIKK
jgi:hypothetical protein